jgi:carbon monoxide dehydrogenase subunit G
MDMTGEYRIPAPRQRVWEALNDPLVLRQAIPGCEQLDKISDQEMTARVKAKVGPVSATFTGKVTLGDLNPPESYTISGEGSGGVAGFAKGGAKVNLADDGADTVLRYEAKADVGGKLAQIGSRLIQGTAKKMADDFFSRFSRIVGEQHAAAAAVVAPVVPPPMAPEPVPPAAFEPVAAPPEAAEPEAPAAAVPPSLSTEAAAGGTPPFVPETPPQPSPAARAAPSQFVKRETAPPAPPPTPPAPPPAQPGMLQQPLVWAAIAVVILVLLYLIL